MKKSGRDPSVNGIRVGALFALFMLISCVVSTVVLILSLSTRTKFTKIITNQNQMSIYNDSLEDLQRYSVNLTQMARVFAVSQEPLYMEDYISEVLRFKSREDSLKIIETFSSNQELRSVVAKAYEEAAKLSEWEFYAMRLVCDAINLDDSILPQQLKDVDLQQDDISLSKEVKLEIARNMLFDEDYLFSQYTLEEDVVGRIGAIMEEESKAPESTQFEIDTLFVILFIFISVLIGIGVCTYFIFVKQISFPLKGYVRNITTGIPVKANGAYEVQYIAKSYNELCAKNEMTASVLKHKAEHDPLTGLINRAGFEQIKTVLSNSDEPIAYLIIDIDLFKNINDKFGHAVGDDVLRKVSNLFVEQFRGSDYVARIGGDEFAIIMTKFGASPTEIIQSKIIRLNEILQNNKDGLPPVSLSVGVAFSKNGYAKILEKQADDALYRVKRGGRCNCSFYSD